MRMPWALLAGAVGTCRTQVRLALSRILQQQHRGDTHQVVAPKKTGAVVMDASKLPAILQVS